MVVVTVVVAVVDVVSPSLVRRSARGRIDRSPSRVGVPAILPVALHTEFARNRSTSAHYDSGRGAQERWSACVYVLVCLSVSAPAQGAEVEGRAHHTVCNG